MDVDSAITAALRNVAEHGDTDIFSFPFENLLFRDRLPDAAKLIKEIHAKPEQWLSLYPPQTMRSLAQVGYAGFRWATLIDPFWNAYYLSLVLSIADKIDSVRPAVTRTRRPTVLAWPGRTHRPEPSCAGLRATPVRSAHRRVRNATAPPSSPMCDLALPHSSMQRTSALPAAAAETYTAHCHRRHPAVQSNEVYPTPCTTVPSIRIAAASDKRCSSGGTSVTQRISQGLLCQATYD